MLVGRLHLIFKSLILYCSALGAFLSMWFMNTLMICQNRFEMHIKLKKWWFTNSTQEDKQIYTPAMGWTGSVNHWKFLTLYCSLCKLEENIIFTNKLGVPLLLNNFIGDMVPSFNCQFGFFTFFFFFPLTCLFKTAIVEN